MLRQGKARGEYCRIFKSFNAAWVKICPSKPIRVRLLSAYAKKGGASTNVFVATAWYTQSMPAPPRLDLALAPSFLVLCSFEAEIFCSCKDKAREHTVVFSRLWTQQGRKRSFQNRIFYCIRRPWGARFIIINCCIKINMLYTIGIINIPLMYGSRRLI